MTKTKAVPKEISNQRKVKNKALIEKRLDQISDNAMKLFAEKGYHNTSVRDIANLSRISTGSIYDYVRNKEDILFLVSAGKVEGEADWVRINPKFRLICLDIFYDLS